MHLTGDCVEGGYFRASRLGVRRCFSRLGVGWWVYKFEMVLRVRRAVDCIESGASGAGRGSEESERRVQ